MSAILPPVKSVKEFINRRIVDNNAYLLSNLPKYKSGEILGIESYYCASIEAVLLQKSLISSLANTVNVHFLKAIKRDYQYGNYTRVDLGLKGMDNANKQLVGGYAALVEGGYPTLEVI